MAINIILWVCFLFVLSGSLSTTTAQTFEGRWSSNHGQLRLHQIGHYVIGDYADQGVIAGIVKNGRLEGQFTNGSRAGTFQFTRSGSNLRGEWSWINSNGGGTWKATFAGKPGTILRNFSRNGEPHRTIESDRNVFDGVFSSTYGKLQLFARDLFLVGNYADRGVIMGIWDGNSFVGKFTNGGQVGWFDLAFFSRTGGFREGRRGWFGEDTGSIWNLKRISRGTITLSNFNVNTATGRVIHPGVDRVVKKEILRQKLRGVAVGVVKNGQIIHLKGYGQVTINTPFRWASVSKPLTAVAAFQLIESEDLELSDKVVDIVSYWPDDGRKDDITVAHLLSHRSGINHYDHYDKSKYTSTSSYNAKQSVAVFKNADLNFAPGNKHSYTTFGYNLLGAVIEEVSPNGYVAWIETHIANPLNMESLQPSTGFFLGYRQHCDGRIIRNRTENQLWKLPGGGWESNIEDLTRFVKGLLKETFLTNTSILWNNVRGNSTYGYGINHLKAGSELRVWHGGAQSNVRSMLYLYPNDNLGIAILTKSRHTNIFRLAHHIANIFGKSWNDSREPTRLAAGDAAARGEYVGVWRRTGEDVLIRRGYRHGAFYDEWKRLRDAGYYADDFEPYIDSDGVLRWDGTFRKGSGANAIWRGFDLEGFHNKWVEQSHIGDEPYLADRLIDLETYIQHGERKWAGLFRPGSGRYALFRNFSTDDFKDKHNALANDGYKLIDVEAYVRNGRLNWAGVWVAGNASLLTTNYSTNKFHNLWPNRLAEGYRLIDIEVYRVGGELLWAGVWEHSNQEERLDWNYNFCDFMRLHKTWRRAGFELIDLERY